MKKIQLITFASLFTFFSFSCDSNKANNTVVAQQESASTKVAQNVSAQEFHDLINSDVIILDVRTPREYNAGHLDGALNINFYDPDFLEQIEKLNKSNTVLIYCASGGRSAKAMSKMSKSNFNAIYNLQGGIPMWSRAGYEVVK